MSTTGPEYGPGGDLEAIAKAKENYDALLADQEKEADLRDKKQRAIDVISRKNAEDYEIEQKRLAAKDAELELETRIAEARAAGNEQEVKKLEWLQRYNDLLDRGYREDQARRSANAAAAGSPVSTTKPGELFAGSRRRRGATESDAFGESALNLAPGQSLLQQYKDNQSRAVGAVNGVSILGADPAAGAGGAVGKNSGASDMKSATADLGAKNEELNSTVSELAGAVGTLNTGALANLSSTLRELTAKVDALTQKV
jgi:hypothetical protein